MADEDEEFFIFFSKDEDEARRSDSIVAAIPLLLFGTPVRRGFDHVRPSSRAVYSHVYMLNSRRIDRGKYVF